MKNKMKQALRQELRSVKVSEDLKTRILAETVFREKKRSSPLGWLAAAAALILTVGISAGMLVMRTPQNEIPPLSGGDGGTVWVIEEDNLYHGRKNCGGMTGAVRTDRDTARKQGRTACTECIVVSTTLQPEEDPGRVIAQISHPTYLPETKVTPEPEENAAVWEGATPEPTLAVVTACPTPGAEENVVEMDALPTVEPARYTPVPGNAQETPENGITVYTSGNGKFYHLDPGCSGAEGLTPVLLTEVMEAMEYGQENCPVCIGEGTVRILRMETVQADGWASVSVETQTDVEMIEGACKADLSDENVRRILSWLYPNYMDEETAEIFLCRLAAGEVKGFRSTICTPVVADSDRYDAKYTFYENEDDSRRITLLLEGSDFVDMHEIRVHSELMTVEFIFDESGVTDNSVRKRFAVRETDANGNMMALVTMDVSQEQKAMAFIVADYAPVQMASDENRAMRKVLLGDRVYLLPENDAYVSASLEILADNIERCRNDLAAALDLEEELLTTGFRQKTAQEDWWQAACCVDADQVEFQYMEAERVLWATEGGKFYHCVRNCSGMKNAVRVSEAEWETWDKDPCPVCLGTPMVWLPEGGDTYHADPACPGAKLLIEVSAAEAEEKTELKRCEKCF